MLQKYQFKARDPEVKPYTLCLGNISKDFAVNKNMINMTKTGLNGYIYDFPIDYIFYISDIINIHKYLMKKHDIKQCLDFSKKCFLDY